MVACSSTTRSSWPRFSSSSILNEFVKMRTLSGYSEGWRGRCVAAVVAQQRPEDVDAAAGECEHGLGVAFALGSLAVVEGPGLVVAADADECGGVEGSLQAAVVAAGAVQVAA